MFYCENSRLTNTMRAKLKNHAILGYLTALKKSIDWWIDTASIIDESESALFDRSMWCSDELLKSASVMDFSRCLPLLIVNRLPVPARTL